MKRTRYALAAGVVAASMAGLAGLAGLTAAPAWADAMGDAMEFVNKYATKVDTWDGPTSGPAAQPDKTIVVVGADMKNGGILGATNGIEEAAVAIGWEVRVLDGAGSVSGRTSAMSQALALKPDGIILNGFDRLEQAEAMKSATASGIPMVAWHGGSTIGPMPEAGVFANVTTDPMLVSEAAAK